MTFLSNIKFTFRLFCKNLNNSLMGVAVLAVGIAISATMFTFYNGQILSTPSFNVDKEILHVEWVQESRRQRQPVAVNVSDYYALKEKNSSFEQLAAFSARRYQLFHPDVESAAYYQTAHVTNNFFEVVNVFPILGKLPSPEEAENNTQKIVLLSFDIWQKEFMGSPEVIGKSVQLTGTPYTIIGVMPQNFQLPQFQHMWVIDNFKGQLKRDRKKQTVLEVFGFLKSGIKVEQAELDFANIAASLKEQFPEANKNFSRVEIKPYAKEFTGDQLETVFAMFLAFSIVVLIIACANVSNLMMARISKRQHELAIRKSLGANNREIFIQVISDALAISVLGALLGVLITAWASRYIWSMLTNSYEWFPYWWHMDIDATVIGFIFFVTMLSALLSSIVPALKVISNQSIEILKDNTRTSSGLSVGRLSKIMVTLQVFSATVLLCMAFVMMSLTDKMTSRELTFEPEQILNNRIQLNVGLGYKSEASVKQFYQQLTEGVEAISGVESIALSNNVPGIYNVRRWFQVEGRVYETEADKTRTGVSIISNNYLDLVNAKLLQGRNFTNTDVKDSQRVVLVNQHFVERHFPNEDPIGKRVRILEDNGYIGAKRGELGSWATIVGVVSNYQGEGMSYGQGRASITEIYFSAAQKTQRSMQLLVKGSGDVHQLASPINKIIYQLNNKVSAREKYKTIKDRMAINDTFVNLFNLLIKVFASSALLMTGVGLYGLVAFTTQQKVREFGIRMALGASAKRILLLVVKQNKWQIFIGITLGACAGIAVGEVFLNAVEMGDRQIADWYTLPLSVLLVLVVTKLAVIIPAWKATKVPPNVALRTE